MQTVVAKGVRFSAAFVCLIFRTIHVSIETDAASINKLVIEMHHHYDTWNPIYFVVIRSKVKVTMHKNRAGVGSCTPVRPACCNFS